MPDARIPAVISNPIAVAPKPKLFDEVRRKLRLKRYSLRTEQAYLYWIRRYIHFNDRQHPRNLDGKHVEHFLSELAQRHRVAPSTQNQALAALLFLYRQVLAIEFPWMENVIRAKRAPRLPVVLSRAETSHLLNALSGREALMAGLLYGSGLRLMECLRLRIKDIDLERNEITVREGKGGKDRKTVLPERLRTALQVQIDSVRVLHTRDREAGLGSTSLPNALARKYRNADRDLGWQYLFPAARRAVDPVAGWEKRHHLDESVLQRAVKSAARSAGIVKPVSPRTLRHCFATHLLEAECRTPRFLQAWEHAQAESHYAKREAASLSVTSNGQAQMGYAPSRVSPKPQACRSPKRLEACDGNPDSGQPPIRCAR